MATMLEAARREAAEQQIKNQELSVTVQVFLSVCVCVCVCACVCVCIHTRLINLVSYSYKVN